MDSRAESACYPQGSFYPLSDDPSIRNRRITKSCFRTCSTCQSCSQAPLCLCTLRLISIQPEGTFERLRYSFGGDRPSQTAHLALSPVLQTQIRILILRGWYSTNDSCKPSGLQSKSPNYPIHTASRPNTKLQ